MTYRGRSGLEVREVECPSCGCPNKPGDERCMYCRTELNSNSASIRAALNPYLSNIREFFNPEPHSKRGMPAWKLALSALVSSALLAIGAFLLFKGLERGGYFNWTVGILFVIYGAAALRNAWISSR